MDLRGIANGISSVVNANTQVSVKRSTGYTIGADRRQVPAYADPVTGFAQIQALDALELKQLDGLNIQGVIRGIYLRGPLAGTIRATSQGGDMITVASGVHAGTWLVAKVLETWPSWTKAAIVLQVPA
jgi:hypothetical protein